jgi:hypothetical protein
MPVRHTVVNDPTNKQPFGPNAIVSQNAARIVSEATENKQLVPEHCRGEISAQTKLHLYRDSGSLTLRVF